MRDAPGSSRRARGSVLLLAPAGVLVVMVLGAITVDSAVVFLGQRQLADAATAAANDAVTTLLDEPAVRAGSSYRLDLRDAERHVRTWLAVHDLPVTVSDVSITLAGPAAIEVRLTGTVDYVFARALPGGPDQAEVTARATAEATVLSP